MVTLFPANVRAWHILVAYVASVLIAVIICALWSESIYPLTATWYTRRVGALIAGYISTYPGAVMILALVLGFRGRVTWGLALSPPVLILLYIWLGSYI